ncbi:MAG: hypothetical protein K2L37_01595 [Lactobacillus sp.]|nr:hypothetical protein [Lactobacillus sp.]
MALSFLVFIIITILSISALLIVINSKIKQRKYEHIVCRDVTEIYCNTINFINELCSINNHVVQAVEKFLSAVSINDAIETHQLTTLDTEISFRTKEVNELTNGVPSFKLNITPNGKIILAKHKLSELEVASTEMCVNQSINDVLSNFQYLRDSIKGNQYNALGVNFALAQMKSFQYESNAIYYGVLEGLCSFPIEALTLYYEISPRWENMPKGVTLRSLNKEGFKLNQELEFKKAQQCLDAVSGLIEKYGNNVDNIIHSLKRQDVNFFIAGSKSLQQERDVFAGVVSILQSKWKPLGIDVNSYSYQNFPREVTDIPSQEQYNRFIANHVNVAIFILGEKAGSYTMEEFDVAYNNFKKDGTPKIFVYSLNDGNNVLDSEIHQKMQEEKQYWIEFKDVDELRHLLNIDLDAYLLETYTAILKTTF